LDQPTVEEMDHRKALQKGKNLDQPTVEETDHRKALQKGKNLGLSLDSKKAKWLGLL